MVLMLYEVHNLTWLQIYRKSWISEFKFLSLNCSISFITKIQSENVFTKLTVVTSGQVHAGFKFMSVALLSASKCKTFHDFSN